MDFTLSKEYQMVQQLAREFAEKEVKPLAAELDEEERFPVETIPKMFKIGFFGCPYPTEIGGAGGDYVAYSICMEEIAKVCATTACTLSVHSSLGINLMKTYGTPAQKEKYMDKLMHEYLACFCLTEAGAGSDSSGQKTRADKDGDYYAVSYTHLVYMKLLRCFLFDFLGGIA